LTEWGEGVVRQDGEDEVVESLEVSGEVRLRSFLPGDTPKVQVKV
jgi:hypothetical protein